MTVHHECGPVPDCGGTFRCARCKKTVGWCCGASDNRPDVCDACWAELEVPLS